MANVKDTMTRQALISLVKEYTGMQSDKAANRFLFNINGSVTHLWEVKPEGIVRYAVEKSKPDQYLSTVPADQAANWLSGFFCCGAISQNGKKLRPKKSALAKHRALDYERNKTSFNSNNPINDDERTAEMAKFNKDQTEETKTTTTTTATKKTGTAKKAAPKKTGTAKKAAPKKTTTKKAAPKKAAPKKEAPKKEAPKKEAPKKEAPKKEAPKKEAPKKEVVADTTKIKWLVKENPKREGTKSHERFEAYLGAKTVQDYLDAGGSRADLRYDQSKGYLELQ